MDKKDQAFWNKSEENLAVSRYASNKEYYNAASSRYYYALVLAGQALFEQSNIDWNWNDNKHEDFIESLGRLLEDKGYGDIDETVDGLEEARQNRVRADYKPYPVTQRHFDAAETLCQPIWDALETELK